MYRLKEIIKKNDILFSFLKKIRILIYIFIVYLLRVVNVFRVDSCNRNSLRCEENMMNKNYRYSLFGVDTPVCCRTHLYEIAKDILCFLNENEIEYFIMYGTLLGQVRHQNTFIPWDTDVDIVIMKSNKNKVIKMLFNGFDEKYTFEVYDKIVKINYSKNNSLHMDIYFCEEDEGVLVDTPNDWWIKNRVLINDIFPLKSSLLYDIEVKIPHDSVKILKDTYGEDCLDKAYKKYAFKQKNMNVFEKGYVDDKYMSSLSK